MLKIIEKNMLACQKDRLKYFGCDAIFKLSFWKNLNFLVLKLGVGSMTLYERLEARLSPTLKALAQLWARSTSTTTSGSVLGIPEC